MERGRLPPQLPHRPGQENQPATATEHSCRLDGRPEGLGVGVVAVVQDGQSSRLNQVAASRRKGEVLEGPRRGIPVEVQGLDHRPHPGGIVGLVKAPRRQGEGVPADRDHRPGVGAERPPARARGRHPAIPAVRTRRARRRAPSASSAGFRADDRQVDSLGEGELLLDHAGQRPEAFEVAGHGVGDDRDARLDDLRAPGRSRPACWRRPRSPAPRCRPGPRGCVSGTPTRLLRLARVACTAYRVPSAAASISLVLVFPFVPVMAITGPEIRLRRARARRPSANSVSATS